jgi:formamidopyrimidine-DNA glycosylase
MPEIVEVKKYVDFINKNVSNNKLIDINIINGRYKKHYKFEMYDKVKKNLPLKLNKNYSKGKLIYFEFISNNNIKFYLLNTLGLSGGWIFNFNNRKKYIIPRLLEYIDEIKIENYLLRNLNHISIEFIFTNGTLYFFVLLIVIKN